MVGLALPKNSRMREGKALAEAMLRAVEDR